MTYAGRSFTLDAGEKLEHVNDAAKNLLMTHYQQRGLVALGYNDNGHEEEIAKRAREVNRKFKIDQIRRYNQDNENRKHDGKKYIPPTGKVRDYAEELHITLNEPYAVRDAEREAIASTKNENEALTKKVNELTDLVAKLLEAQGKGEPEPDKSELRVRKDGKWVKE